MEGLQTILLLLVYVGLVIFAMRGGNLIFGFLLSALAWAIIGHVPCMATVNDVIQKGAESLRSYRHCGYLRQLVRPHACRNRYSRLPNPESCRAWR